MENTWEAKYSNKKNNTAKGNLKFYLSYSEYVQKAKEAGLTCPSQIGKGINKYQLARYKDQGDYTVENCRFITQLENIRERNEHFDISSQVSKRNYEWSKNKTHPFLGGGVARKSNLKQLKDGTHTFLNSDIQRKRSKLNNKNRIENGTHNFLNKQAWLNYSSTNESLKVWAYADEIYNFWKITKKEGRGSIKKKFFLKSDSAINNMIKKFKSGWVPEEDTTWLKWRNNKNG